MPVELITASSGGGKTDYALDLARRAAQGLRATPHVCLPSRLQELSFRRRMAAKGGALGVYVTSFKGIFAHCLDSAHVACEPLADPIRHRILRSLLHELPLRYYSPLREYPGFLRQLASLIAELKRQMVLPADFKRRIEEPALNVPRLQELLLIYQAYQERLDQRGWADDEELALLALGALERDPRICSDWGLLIVDGFDSFTTVQLRTIQLLASRVSRLIITLTGQREEQCHTRVHGRFANTLRQLQEALAVEPQPLPAPAQARTGNLQHLVSRLFLPRSTTVEADGSIEIVEATTRVEEVRVALRWIKKRLAYDGVPLSEMAILARDLTPYRALIAATAKEFDLPVCFPAGFPLSSDPAIAALFDLMEIMRSGDPSNGPPEPRLPRRLVIEAWRSPYFDWRKALPGDAATRPIGITPEDAGDLAAAAIHGQVIGGWTQWQETLSLLSRARHDQAEGEQTARERLPLGTRAEQLLAKLTLFRKRLTPPVGGTFSDYVTWLEDLIGIRSGLPLDDEHYEPDPASLRVLQLVLQSDPRMRERDLAALEELHQLLRSLARAQSMLAPDEPVSFDRFLDELMGAAEAASYHLPQPHQPKALLACDVLTARGLPFRAAALMGLSEGEFPAVIHEHPLLRESDRQALREGGSSIESSLVSHEAEYFSEAITRATQHICVTRPRLTDDGAPWQPSPFWEEITRLVSLVPREISSFHVVPPAEAASWPEALEAIAQQGGSDWETWVSTAQSEAWQAVAAGAEVLKLRQAGGVSVEFDGDLSALEPEFIRRYGPQHIWSASRLESYRCCPFLFFVGSVLRLEPLLAPAEGMDVAQLGSTYHRILERLYGSVRDTTDSSALQAALPAVARQVLDEAPAREGFRVTAWWDQIRAEIEEDVRRTVEALSEPEMLADYRPARFEQHFGWRGEPPLRIEVEEEQLLLRGIIDRIDVSPTGIRVIDYKTAGKAGYGNREIREGRRLQLPLYALAVRDALQIGRPADGFYWHVRAAEPSGFRLSTFQEGIEAALQMAVTYTSEAVDGIRAGAFSPAPPREGCPAWCAAASFCWHYRPGFMST